MPFAKSADARKFYTGINMLKSYWKSIIDNINSTPYHQTEAVNNLMYLCAETEEERELRKLALIAFYGKRLGYKPGTQVGETSEPDPIDEKIQSLMDKLGGR
jgi:hypothetical protein